MFELSIRLPDVDCRCKHVAATALHVGSDCSMRHHIDNADFIRSGMGLIDQF